MERYGFNEETGNMTTEISLNDNDQLFQTIVSYMNDEIREDLNSEIAPCTNDEFLIAYVERDPEFLELLESEFSITI